MVLRLIVDDIIEILNFAWFSHRDWFALLNSKKIFSLGSNKISMAFTFWGRVLFDFFCFTFWVFTLTYLSVPCPERSLLQVLFMRIMR
jgi:hypothetical protein